MGTRGLYCAVVDGEIKVAQYGQWDAYPSGQGFTMLKFVQDMVANNRVEDFKTALRQVKSATQEEIEQIWKNAGADGSGLVSMDIANIVRKNQPQFSRDTCAEVMQLVLDGSAKQVHLQTDFAADSLFCEWAYVIDMDNGVLEAYKGFQEKEHKEGRFSHLWDKDNDRRSEKYYPVALVATFDFRALPDKDTFVAICEGDVLERLANLPPT